MSEGAPTDWRGDVLRYWFALKPEQWWHADPDLDADIRERFRDLWEDKRELPASSFLDDPLTALAGVILFDQVPRNIFRGHADSYSTDPLALAIAEGAVDKGFDDQLPANERSFLYMPFEHSEDMDDQRRSLLLFTRLGDANMLGFAKKHHDIVERFGRFPHRNGMLGRQPRADEIAAGDVVPW
jgi:uncharacterized protein (DUF924 family)